MKKLVLIFLIICKVVGSQNLVPNWSFETYTSCPTGGGEIYKAVPWVSQTATATTDYFHTCSGGVPYSATGFQYAKDGNGYLGFWFYSGPFSVNGREYAQVQLIDTMTTNKCYYVEYYANLNNNAKWACNNIAANLSKIQYTTTGTGFVLNLPQHITNYGNKIIKDTLNWTKISGIYNAGGGGKYLTIGNFKDDVNTDTSRVIISPTSVYGAYYLLDAVSVYSINPNGVLPWQYRDTTVAIGDSAYIGNTMGGTFTSNWYTYGGSFINSGSGIYVKPVTTSTYVVQFTVCGVSRTDTLKVTVTGVGIHEFGAESLEIMVSPNPNNGIFDLEILNKEFEIGNSETKITNVLGQEVKREKLTSKKQKINLEELEDGLYYFQIIKQNRVITVKKILKQ